MRKLDKSRLCENVLTNIEKDIEKSNIAGAAVLVAQDGNILLCEARGHADIEKRTPLKTNSVFRIASMTKPITAAAALISVERGYFKLTDRISTHFPEFSYMQVGGLKDGRVIPIGRAKKFPTLSDLLSHTSGFMCSSPLYNKQYEEIPKSEFESGRRMVDYCLRNTYLTFEPCEAVGYGPHLPFDMLAVLIENKSGMSYSEFLKENIFSPLEMCDTGYALNEEQWGRAVTMCDRGKNTPLHNVDLGSHSFEDYPESYTSAGAGLFSTLNDYFKFAETLRCAGEYNGKRVISEENIRKMSTNIVNKSLIGNNSTTTYGLSVRVILKGYPFLAEGSYGWSGAYGTHFFVDPENKITAIYMKNTYRYDSLGAGKTGREFEKAVTNSLVN